MLSASQPAPVPARSLQYLGCFHVDDLDERATLTAPELRICGRVCPVADIVGLRDGHRCACANLTSAMALRLAAAKQPEVACCTPEHCLGTRTATMLAARVPFAPPAPPDLAAQPVHVVTCTDGPGLVGMAALARSLAANTRATVQLHIVTTPAAAERVQRWLGAAQDLPSNLHARVVAFDAARVQSKIRVPSAHHQRLASPVRIRGEKNKEK